MGSGALPRLPGGWKPICALLVLLLVATVAVEAWRAREWRSGVGLWMATHPATLAITGIALAALALRVYSISDNLPFINQPAEPAGPPIPGY